MLLQGLLEREKLDVVSMRDEKIKEMFKKGDKGLEKRSKKEEKIANRILWVVITKLDGSVGVPDEDLVEVDSVET